MLAIDEELVIDWDLGPRPRATNGNGHAPAAAHSPSGTAGADTTHAPAPQAANEPPATLEALERAHIISVLKGTHGVIEGLKGAARILNLKPSTTRFRMKKLGITKADYL
ncbi:MAG: hypothetical protein WDO68_24825 [Gammaproteobacteria bacterium]